MCQKWFLKCFEMFSQDQLITSIQPQGVFSLTRRLKRRENSFLSCHSITTETSFQLRDPRFDLKILQSLIKDTLVTQDVTPTEYHPEVLYNSLPVFFSFIPSFPPFQSSCLPYFFFSSQIILSQDIHFGTLYILFQIK